ncbi:MAG: hypothetical protein NXY57DRAFT_907584 [Lentinula lateritia]|nr:MAG: hypothetical protein NXY57DRAFT_907584 [Lentinula lateritia]
MSYPSVYAPAGGFNLHEDELVKYIVEYSLDKVKDLILYMDEFDADSKVTWKAAKEVLITLYGSSDKPKEYTEEELKEFCRERSAKPSFSKASDIEDYLRAFVAIAASLKKCTVISEKEYNLYFVRGLDKCYFLLLLTTLPSRLSSRHHKSRGLFFPQTDTWTRLIPLQVLAWTD